MKRLLILAVLGLLASACRIDATIGIDLDRPGNVGDLSIRLETDEEFERLFAITDRQFEDLVAERGAATGLTFRLIEDGSTTTYTSQAEGLTYDAIENILARLAPGLGRLTITNRGTTLEIDADLNSLQDLEDVAPFFTDFDPAAFQEDVNVALRITVPGEITSSSADSISGATYQWDLPFSPEATRVITRSTLVQESDGGISVVTAIALIALLAAFGFLLAIRGALSRNEEEDTSVVGPPPTPPEQQEPPSIPPEDQPVFGEWCEK